MTDPEILITARRRVAERYPGCARPILSENPLSNWDRGSLVQQAVRDIERERSGG